MSGNTALNSRFCEHAGYTRCMQKVLRPVFVVFHGNYPPEAEHLSNKNTLFGVECLL